MWFPQSERSLATAIFDSSAKLASAIGVPVLGLLLLRVGWRASFGFTAALSFGFLLLFWKVYRDPGRMTLRDVVSLEPEEATREMPEFLLLAAAPPIALSRLLRERKVVGLGAIGFGAYNYVFYLLLTWLPTYLREALHATARNSFLFTRGALDVRGGDGAGGGWGADGCADPAGVGCERGVGGRC